MSRSKVVDLELEFVFDGERLDWTWVRTLVLGRGFVVVFVLVLGVVPASATVLVPQSPRSILALYLRGHRVYNSVPCGDGVGDVGCKKPKARTGLVEM